MPANNIQSPASASPYPKKRNRMAHATIPKAIIHLTPSFLKKNGINKMKNASENWPKVMLLVTFFMPASVRNRLVKL